ncbi:unnamed protein product [Thelazia callipaeda]|uniref:VWFA domain-containing protein n=1 Tax=Thelazia callipaeda TaxID=103827 RepID=A0A0N5DA38_THECL|nr:unnamed protein product [Thelazia callipaeda]
MQYYNSNARFVIQSYLNSENTIISGFCDALCAMRYLDGTEWKPINSIKDPNQTNTVWQYYRYNLDKKPSLYILFLADRTAYSNGEVFKNDMENLNKILHKTKLFKKRNSLIIGGNEAAYYCPYVTVTDGKSNSDIAFLINDRLNETGITESKESTLSLSKFTALSTPNYTNFVRNAKKVEGANEKKASASESFVTDALFGSIFYHTTESNDFVEATDPEITPSTVHTSKSFEGKSKKSIGGILSSDINSIIKNYDESNTEISDQIISTTKNHKVDEDIPVITTEMPSAIQVSIKVENPKIIHKSKNSFATLSSKVIEESRNSSDIGSLESRSRSLFYPFASTSKTFTLLTLNSEEHNFAREVNNTTSSFQIEKQIFDSGKKQSKIMESSSPLTSNYYSKLSNEVASNSTINNGTVDGNRVKINAEIANSSSKFLGKNVVVNITAPSSSANSATESNVQSVSSSRQRSTQSGFFLPEISEFDNYTSNDIKKKTLGIPNDILFYDNSSTETSSLSTTTTINDKLIFQGDTEVKYSGSDQSKKYLYNYKLSQSLSPLLSSLLISEDDMNNRNTSDVNNSSIISTKHESDESRLLSTISASTVKHNSNSQELQHFSKNPNQTISDNIQKKVLVDYEILDDKFLVSFVESLAHEISTEINKDKPNLLAESTNNTSNSVSHKSEAKLNSGNELENTNISKKPSLPGPHPFKNEVSLTTTTTSRAAMKTVSSESLTSMNVDGSSISDTSLLHSSGSDIFGGLIGNFNKESSTTTKTFTKLKANVDNSISDLDFDLLGNSTSIFFSPNKIIFDDFILNSSSKLSSNTKSHVTATSDGIMFDDILSRINTESSNLGDVISSPSSTMIVFDDSNLNFVSESSTVSDPALSTMNGAKLDDSVSDLKMVSARATTPMSSLTITSDEVMSHHQKFKSINNESSASDHKINDETSTASDFYTIPDQKFLIHTSTPAYLLKFQSTTESSITPSTGLIEKFNNVAKSKTTETPDIAFPIVKPTFNFTLPKILYNVETASYVNRTDENYTYLLVDEVDYDEMQQAKAVSTSSDVTSGFQSYFKFVDYSEDNSYNNLYSFEVTDQPIYSPDEPSLGKLDLQGTKILKGENQSLDESNTTVNEENIFNLNEQVEDLKNLSRIKGHSGSHVTDKVNSLKRIMALPITSENFMVTNRNGNFGQKLVEVISVELENKFSENKDKEVNANTVSQAEMPDFTVEIGQTTPTEMTSRDTDAGVTEAYTITPITSTKTVTEGVILSTEAKVIDYSTVAMMTSPTISRLLDVFDLNLVPEEKAVVVLTNFGKDISETAHKRTVTDPTVIQLTTEEFYHSNANSERDEISFKWDDASDSSPITSTITPEFQEIASLKKMHKKTIYRAPKKLRVENWSQHNSSLLGMPVHELSILTNQKKITQLLDEITVGQTAIPTSPSFEASLSNHGIDNNQKEFVEEIKNVTTDQRF